MRKFSSSVYDSPASDSKLLNKESIECPVGDSLIKNAESFTLETWFNKTRQPLSLDPDSRQALIRNQNEINRQLIESLSKISLENNMTFLLTTSQKYMSILRKLSSEKRNTVILEMFRRVQNLDEIPPIVQKLKPIPGVREAVQDFLAEKVLEENEVPFSSEQIDQMFEGLRFNSFFPKCNPNAYMNHNKKANLHFAILTLKDRSIDNNIIHKYRSIYGEIDILGFNYPCGLFALMPILHQAIGDEREDMISLRGRRGMDRSPFKDKELSILDEKFISLIALGFYHKQGHSTFLENLDRGASQFESEMPRMYECINQLLENSHLARMPRLYRRLLAESWGCFNTDSNLVEQIRFLALDLQDLPDFMHLRIEIHNLPTQKTLQKTEEYKNTHPLDQENTRMLDKLIESMKDFLGVSDNSQKKSVESWAKIRELREINHTLPDTIDNLLADQAYRANALNLGQTEILALEKIEDQNQLFHSVLTLSKNIIEQIVLDDMLSTNVSSQYINELDSLKQDPSLENLRKMELMRNLLENIVDVVREPIQFYFSKHDDILTHLDRRTHTAVRLVDSLLRSNTIFLVGKLVDRLSSFMLSRHHHTHLIADINYREPVEVFNPGRAEGVLRINKHPLEMRSGEIGVFTETPSETTSIAGIITFGSVARLSHLSLLAKGLKTPIIRVDGRYMEVLRQLEGKKILLTASKEGILEIMAAEAPLTLTQLSSLLKERVEIPKPNNTIKSPTPFSAIKNYSDLIAGPKGIQLAKMFNSEKLGSHVPNGFIIPFGFFKKYAKNIGLSNQLQLLSEIFLENRDLILDLSGQIQDLISKNPIPSDMLKELYALFSDLEKQVPSNSGFFIRSDTNVEDLLHFNGAGLNKTVPNIKLCDEEIDKAVRKVWKSPFSEKSIYWRAKALASPTVTIAQPSIVVLPTVKASASGVLVSGGKEAKNAISANRGIGSVVEASKAVEEITLETENPHRFSFSASLTQPVARRKGGLKEKRVETGKRVLSESQIQELKKVGEDIEQVLGFQRKGWDIEWAFDENAQLVLLQARPNM